MQLLLSHQILVVLLRIGLTGLATPSEAASLVYHDAAHHPWVCSELLGYS